MGLFDSLFGKRPGKREVTPEPAEVPDPEDFDPPTGMLVVFAGPLAYRSEDLRATLAAMGPSLRSVTVQAVEGSADRGTPVNRVTWAEHVVDVIGLEVSVPEAAVENCVQPAHYSQAIKAQVRAHRSHAILYYSGGSSDPRERYVALAAVAGAFAKHGAIGVLNESAMTSLPAGTVYDLCTAQPDFAVLRVTPLLMLFCGFVKYFLPDGERAWIRTYNNPTFGLPDLAARATLDEGQATFELFTALMDYLLESGATFAPGHTAQFGDRRLRFRAPRDDSRSPPIPRADS